MNVELINWFWSLWEVLNQAIQVTLPVSLWTCQRSQYMSLNVHVDNSCFPWAFFPAVLAVSVPSFRSSSSCPFLHLAVCHVSPLSALPVACVLLSRYGCKTKQIPGSLFNVQSLRTWNLQIHNPANCHARRVYFSCQTCITDPMLRFCASKILKTDIRFTQKVKVLNCKRLHNVKIAYSNPHQILATSYPTLPASPTRI